MGYTALIIGCCSEGAGRQWELGAVVPYLWRVGLVRIGQRFICPVTCCSQTLFMAWPQGNSIHFQLEKSYLECLVCARHCCGILRCTWEQNKELNLQGAYGLEADTVCYMYTLDKELLRHGMEPRLTDAAPLALLSFKQMFGEGYKTWIWGSSDRESSSDSMGSASLSFHPLFLLPLLHLLPPFLPPFLLMCVSSLYHRSYCVVK